MEIYNSQKFETIKTEYINNWLYIRLNRPERKNALSKKMINELLTIIQLSAFEKKIRGILLTGEGESFCSGADLNEFKSFFSNGKPNKNQVISSSLEVAKLLQSFYFFPKIVIVCINGPAFAGGFGLACCSDFIFSTEVSKFGITEVKIGLTPAQIAPYVINRIGLKNTRKLMLTGDIIDTSEGLKNGLLDKIFKNENEMFSYVDHFIKKLSSGSPNAIKVTKRIISDIDKTLRKDFSNRAAEKFSECMLNDESLEGLNAFIEKRKPNWNL